MLVREESRLLFLVHKVAKTACESFRDVITVTLEKIKIAAIMRHSGAIEEILLKNWNSIQLQNVMKALYNSPNSLNSLHRLGSNTPPLILTS